ncbi:hypothetical protein BpHYR1_012773 [Brachionus plicatilis]|uniref:Transmembrane protein n=1 Tax=Brachionus plicatilis TaxID=10195 RepID=A0A3M7STJ9_BRAPC|nr:hypothetical protein BpHYR1_012773 [Brachionus plicatilis]
MRASEIEQIKNEAIIIIKKKGFTSLNKFLKKTFFLRSHDKSEFFSRWNSSFFGIKLYLIFFRAQLMLRIFRVLLFIFLFTCFCEQKQKNREQFNFQNCWFLFVDQHLFKIAKLSVRKKFELMHLGVEDQFKISFQFIDMLYILYNICQIKEAFRQINFQNVPDNSLTS